MTASQEPTSAAKPLSPTATFAGEARDPVLEAVSAGIVVFDRQRRLHCFNTAFAELFGLDPAWLSSRPDFLVVIERLRDRRMLPEEADPRNFRTRQVALFQNLDAPRFELLHLPDGRTLQRSAHPHPEGGVIFVFEDQTQHYTLERQYNAQSAVRQATLDSLQDGVAAFGRDGRLKLTNLAFSRMWNLPRDDLAHEPHITRVAALLDGQLEHDPSHPNRREQLTGAVLERRQQQLRLTRRDGRIVECILLPLPDGAVLMNHRDVTDGARVESALAERDEALRTADLSKTAFIANVSFEVRGPLTAVADYAELLAEETFGSLNPRQRSYAEAIRTAANGACAILGDILDLAAIEAGQMQLTITDMDIHDLAARALALIRERARRKGVILDLVCPLDIGCIRADGRRLGQVLHHLLDNALIHTPARGTVRLTAERSSRRLQLSVRDSGSGIAKADRERIFEPFEKGRPAATGEESAGSGLGLTLARRLIGMHGGQIVLASTPGRGTRVSCDIPVDPAEPA